MKIINETLLKIFRSPMALTCDWCGRVGPVEACHRQARGIGGGSRLDIRINILSMGTAFGCSCHRKQHDGTLTVILGVILTAEEVSDRMLAIIARREHLSEVQVREEINRINRLDKDATRCPNHGKGKYAGYPYLFKINEYEPVCPECERSRL